MKIAIVGTGAMGSVYAGLLASAPPGDADAAHEVWAIDTRAEHVEAIARHGLRVSGASGDRVVRVHTAATPHEVGGCDLWVIGTKAADVEGVVERIAPLLRPDDMVMAFQNGLHAGERIARHVAEHHIVIGIAEGFGSFLPRPGHVHHEGMRLIRIGEMRGGLTVRVQALAEMWQAAGFNVKAFADIDRMIWEKFLCNVTLSAPTAAFDVTVGELMTNPATWRVALGCTSEAWQVAQAKGIEFGFDDPLRYVTEFAATIPATSPSMRLDHLAQRRSEVDVINGAVVDLGNELGIPTPYNETLCAVLRQREAQFPA